MCLSCVYRGYPPSTLDGGVRDTREHKVARIGEDMGSIGYTSKYMQYIQYIEYILFYKYFGRDGWSGCLARVDIHRAMLGPLWGRVIDRCCQQLGLGNGGAIYLSNNSNGKWLRTA